MSKAKKPRLSKNPLHEPGSEIEAQVEADENEEAEAEQSVNNRKKDSAEPESDEENVEITVQPRGLFDASDHSSSDDDAEAEKEPAWVDEGDIYTCQEVLDIQGRKCDIGPNASKDYKKSLEERYQSLMGVPKWAKRTAKKDEDWLTHSGNLVKKSTALQKETIEVQKLKDLNKETYSEGPVIKSVLFHPTSTVGLVAGISGTVSLFQVDGKANTKLQSIQYRKFPINCAGFLRNGEEFIVGSQFHHYFYCHDLIKGSSQRVANSRITDITNCKSFRITPDGKYIALLGKFGNIYLLSAVTKELICTLHMNGEVKAVEFHGSLMFSHGEDGQVYVWDMNTRECVHKFIDEGCLVGSALGVSPNGKLLACGSSTGVVNIYDVDSARSSVAPTPIKTVLNLVTPISCVKFNATSELLCMLSEHKDNAIKMLHCPSMTVYSNFPSFRAKFHRPQTVDFSPNSGYFSFGDNKKTAHLFRLKYYGNY